MEWPWPTYPELREVDLESSPKRGSEKINRLKPKRKNKENRLRTQC